MTYEVFALKYRPKTFLDVVGQETVAQTLKRAVQSQRVANAFLFCGSRGTGKTSMARILAKALNCAKLTDGEPCNTCDSCRLVARGEDIDVIEIDGASNRGIDDIRGIKDHVGYVPARSRFKIFIIDEVHMLTIQAFNALLKVLEEPPAHVRFIFATTDPNNLPDTILSRCQRYEFRRISTEDIVGRLADIARREGIEVGRDVLEAMATKSEGGMRDSVSLLDQVVSFAGTKIVLEDLERAIGTLPREHLEGLLRATAEGDAAGVYSALDQAHGSGFDPQELLHEFILLLRAYMIWHAVPATETDPRRVTLFAHLRAAMPMDRVMYLLRLMLATRAEMKRSGHERIQLELALLKGARSVDFLPVEDILDRLRGGVVPDPPRPSSAPTATPPPRVQSVPEIPSRIDVRPASSDVSGPAQPPPPVTAAAPSAGVVDRPANVVLEFGTIVAIWGKVKDAVRKRSSVLGSALAEARPVRLDGRRLTLEISPSRKFQHQQLTTTSSIQTIAESLRTLIGQEVTVSVVLGAEANDASADAERKSVYDDPNVKKIIDFFDGGVIHVEKRDG